MNKNSLSAEPSKKSFARRKQILETAYRCFARDGLEATSLNAIARECGANPSLLLYHFKNRDEIFFEVVKRVVLEAKKILDTYAADGAEGIRAVVDGMFDWVALDRERQSLMMQFYHQCIFKSEFRALHHQVVLESNERVAKILRASGTSNVNERAEAIQFLISGALLRIISQEEIHRIPQLRKIVQEQALLLFQNE